MFFLKKLFAKKADSKNDETNEGALLPDTDFAEEQNAEADDSEFFENSPSDKIEEVYFYRIFCADSFLCTNQKFYDADEPLILRTDAGTGSKSAYINETYIPVKSSGENFLQFEDGTKSADCAKRHYSTKTVTGKTFFTFI
ncbi:hypothetical protein [Treponema sp.]|uniref:hypothetical protein n=1 Tax=Treponema sp. TaxID=166 RepID=UPI00388D6BC6